MTFRRGEQRSRDEIFRKVRRGADPDLDRAADAVLALDPGGKAFGQVIRESYDQVYDGQHTGRYRVDQLVKTEQTHMGTVVEMNIHKRFGFEDGDTNFDFKIDGVNVDCKFSKKWGSWMIPPEIVRHQGIALLVWADDEKGVWTAGLLRVHPEMLLSESKSAAKAGKPGSNRDEKGTIIAAARPAIRVLWKDQPLPENTLLQLPSGLADRIFNADGGRISGASKVRTLFRLVQHHPITRVAVVTVAEQDDSLKRLRDARLALRKEGIIILTHWETHKQIARELGVKPAARRTFVSARVAAAERTYEGKYFTQDGKRYRLAKSTDVAVSAPKIPWRAPAD